MIRHFVTCRIAVYTALLSSLANAADAQNTESLSGTSGRYAAVMEMDKTLADHTVYRPAEISKVQGKLPVVSFGNGGCINIGSAFKTLLGEVASHGYLAIATGPIGPPAGGPSGREQSKTESLVKAIDWAIAENARKGSPYYGRIDTTKIAVAGQSCGGLQAIAVGADPRVTTVLVLNSGIIRGGIPTPDGGTRQPAGYLPASDADLPKLHTPMLYLIGGEKDQAHRGAEGDFEAIQKVPVFNANTPVGHGGTWGQPGGGAMGKVVIDWLNWRLKGDDAAAKTFNGDPCGLCKDTAWTVKRKNWK
jgi:hypothetical protein